MGLFDSIKGFAGVGSGPGVAVNDENSALRMLTQQGTQDGAAFYTAAIAAQLVRPL